MRKLWKPILAINCSRELEICGAGSVSLSKLEVQQQLRLNKEK